MRAHNAYLIFLLVRFCIGLKRFVAGWGMSRWDGKIVGRVMKYGWWQQLNNANVLRGTCIDASVHKFETLTALKNNTSGQFQITRLIFIRFHAAKRPFSSTRLVHLKSVLGNGCNQTFSSKRKKICPCYIWWFIQKKRDKILCDTQTFTIA